MKKFLRTGKKTLSVFLAVLMAFTALVFAAPQKASAVEAGKYYVRVTCYNDNPKDAKGSYTAPWQDSTGGYAVNGNYSDAKNSNGRTSYNSGGGYTIFYKKADGTESYVTKDLETFIYKGYGYEGKTESFVTACNGFPTKIQYYNSESDGISAVISEWHIQKIEVASKSDMSDAQTLWSGNFGVDSKSSAYIGYIYLGADGKTNLSKPKGGTTGSWETVTNSGYDSKWATPVPYSIKWTSASESNMTISTGSTTVNRAFKFNVLDQYGVVMGTSALEAAGAEPTVTVSALNFGEVSTGTDANLYYSFENGTDSYKATVYAKPSLKSLTQGINSYEVTVYVSVPGTGIGESKTFTIYDPKYTVYFDANDGEALIPASTQVYYGESLNSQAALDGTSNYPTSGTYAGHSWLGLFDARTGGNAMDPNAAVTASKTYYAQWDENTYVVVFLDKEGKSADIQYVPYGGNADAAAAEAKLDAAKATAEKHFVFSNWDQSVNSVSSNMIVKAVYTEGTHTFDTGVDVAANCQHGAGKEYTCTVCGYKKIEETSSVLGGHTLTGLIQDVAPTCTEEGKGHKECTVCSAKVEADTAIPALGHSYKIEVNTPATCAAGGERTLTCTRCGVVTTEAIPMVQHNYVVKSHEAATCENSSYDVMECSVCKDTYKEYLGAASIDHSWTESYDKASGILTLTCSVCGTVKTVDIGADLENYVGAEVTTEPTCNADGVVTVTAGSGSYTVKIEKENIPHRFETTVTPATCESNGKILNVCSVCGYKDEANAKPIEKLGHDLEETITTPATCEAAGVKTISCKRDGCTYSTTENISATGHKKSEVVLNCTSGGVIKCANCGADLETVAAKAHDYSGAVRTVPATCVADGISYTKCVFCEAEKAEPIAKLAHDFDSSAWTDIVPATCGAKGVQKRVCANCDAVELRETAALDHDVVTKSETFATCIKAGVKIEKCSRLGCDYVNTTVSQPTGHTLDGGVAHAQTCTNGKYTVYSCTNTDANTGNKCDYKSYEFATGEEGKALGHDFAVEASSVAPTCENDGSKTMKCSRCDETETTVLPKLGHNFTADANVAETCTTSGYTVMKCSNTGCDKTYNEYKTDPLGHSWGAWAITTQPTNTTDGEMERSCTVAGCTATETAPIPMGDHEFDLTRAEITKQATCTAEGEAVYACTKHVDTSGNNTCGVAITVKTAKAAHKLHTSVTYPKCERIYNEDKTSYTDVFTAGKVVVRCSNAGCGYVDETASLVLAAPSDHKWGSYQTLVDATCEADGIKVRYCKACGAEDKTAITERPDHNFIATVVAPTCTDRGFTTYACKGCGMTYRDNFTEALGHDYDDGVAVAATCTTPGGILYTCQREFETEKIVDGNKVTTMVPCGHEKFVEDENQPAFGHNPGEWKYVAHPSEADAYAKERICTNPGCTFSEYETGAGDEHSVDGVNVYYKVNFYNEWVTDTYDELLDHRIYSNGQDPSADVYTKLSKTYKTVELASIYVLKNTEAVYPGKTNPVREKDVDWGGYYFEGWTTKGQLPVGKDDVSAPLDISRITANTDLYALFKCRDVYYHVRFYNANGKPLTKETTILHGHSAEWPEIFGTPEMPDDVTWKYTFKGWAYDYTKIYDDVSIVAVYEATAKEYNLEYYDENGNLLATEVVTNGKKLENVPVISPTQKEDKKYVYVFTGTWVRENGAAINTDSFAVPVGANEGDTFKVTAKYSKRQKVYPVKLHIVDPYDNYAPLNNVTVQVMDSKGQLIATGETNADGDVSFGLYYDTFFTFSAVRGNYYKEGIMSFDEGVEGNVIKKMLGTNDYQGTIQLEVQEDPNAGKKCGCICHTFLSGIWITFLNLLYKLFGIKHVCCYDMYAVHGDKLAYGNK